MWFQNARRKCNKWWSSMLSLRLSFFTQNTPFTLITNITINITNIYFQMKLVLNYNSHIFTSINSLTKVSLHNVTRGILHNTWGGSHWPFHLQIPPGALNMTTNSGEPGFTLDLLPKFYLDTSRFQYISKNPFVFCRIYLTCFLFTSRIWNSKPEEWGWQFNISVFILTSPLVKRLLDLTT